MKDSICWILRGLVVGAWLQQGIAPSAAQPYAIWPQTPVRLIVPAAAGGSADVLARQVALQMEADLKQTFIVENRPGGGNLIGARAVVSAAPDGYTLLAHGIGSHVIATAETPNALDPSKDFTHIAYVGGVPVVLAVSAAVPVKDVASLVAYSRSFPDGLNWGSPGPGTRSHIIGELFRDATKARITHIPYKGAGQAVIDLLGSHIPIAFLTINSARSLIDDGRVRALAVSSKRRLAHYPSVPTFAELGFPMLTGSSWFGVSGPPGMPAALANQINADVNRAVASTAVTKFLAAADFEPIAMSASEFTQFFLAEVNLLEPFIRAMSQPAAAQ
jgi:tripartite-type tricarboxylate transporter receptor subunit TctC